MSRIVWSPRAVRDIEAIRDFIANDSPFYAGLVVQRIVAAVERLSVFPQSGRKVPELDSDVVREVVSPPFRIVYRARNDLVEIVTVFRSSRLLRGEPQ